MLFTRFDTWLARLITFSRFRWFGVLLCFVGILGIANTLYAYRWAGKHYRAVQPWLLLSLAYAIVGMMALLWLRPKEGGERRFTWSAMLVLLQLTTYAFFWGVLWVEDLLGIEPYDPSPWHLPQSLAFDIWPLPALALAIGPFIAWMIRGCTTRSEPLVFVEGLGLVIVVAYVIPGLF